MNKRHLISRSIRSALMMGVVITAAGYTPAAPAANTKSVAHLGKVTVTGTRIKRTTIETAQPITRISREQIQRSGYTSIGQLLGRLSFAGAHQGVRDKTTVNLRNLGSSRNLVLVNGKRWIQGLGGATNLNTIPVSLIDHIEILQDGASAVYGSDAITGVVNIITVKNFNGVEAHAYYGIRNDHKTGDWDGQIKQYDFTVGSGNKRGNVVFNATYRERNPVFRGARKLVRTRVAGEPKYIGAKTGNPAGHILLSGLAVSGRTFGQGTCGTYDPANSAKTLCSLTLRNAPAQPSIQNFRDFKITDQFSTQPLSYVQSFTKNVTAYIEGHYDIFDNVTFTANAAYIRGEASRVISPNQIKVGVTSHKTANGEKIGIDATNPYNPFGKDLVASTSAPCISEGSCIGLLALYRINTEAGHRDKRYNRDYFHIFAGFNGYIDLFNREIDWDVGFAQNRLQSLFFNVNNAVFNYAHVAKALGPISQCTAPCVPLNLFGGSVANGSGSITQAQRNYLGYENHLLRQSNLRDWTANLSSNIYDLPAGPLGLALGYERVDNYGYLSPDATQVQGNSSDSNPSPTNGRVVRDAEYAELNIPLLADLPGAKELSVDIANRWTQFKRTGSVGGQYQRTFVHNSSGRLNIRWQVINDLLLRASWSQGFRSPNINDLFGGTGGAYVNITDPCADGPNGGYQGGPLPPNCPNGTIDSEPSRFINVTSGSNPHVEPESSISRTIGFVYSPSQAPGLDINADYFKIELTNALGSVGYQNILSGCFNNSSFCKLVTVVSNQVTDIRNVLTNVGGLLTEGIDFGLHYKFPSTSFGDFDARINGTFLKTFDSTRINRATRTGFATSHLAGISEQPKRRFNGYVDWDYGNWSARYRIEYFGAVVERCGVAVSEYCTYPKRTTNFQGESGGFPLGRQHLGATVYHDVNVGYTVPSINTTFTLGVNNLFDKKPPIGGNGQLDFNGYRRPSRLVYGSVRVRF